MAYSSTHGARSIYRGARACTRITGHGPGYLDAAGFPATNQPNDRDLDLVLIDELADVVILMNNSGITPLGDLDGDGSVGVVDLLILLGNWGPCPDPPTTCPVDLDGDGNVGVVDLLILLGNWG